MPPLRTLSSHAALLVRDDIDTDQIIPARFLTTTTRKGLGAHLFSDWRYDGTGAPRADFVLNASEAQGAQVLVAGQNFGCGSSREHAPWALADWGIRVVIARSFADIFRNNAHKNGILTITLGEDVFARVHAILQRTPGVAVRVDLEQQVVRVGDANADEVAATFEIDPFARRCLLDGLDELELLLRFLPQVAVFEARRDTVHHALRDSCLGVAT